MQASFKKFRTWQKDFLSRRPHRSFRRTERRDYIRPLELPGYFAFTHYVNTTVWANRKVLLGLAAVYLVLFVVLVGVGSQETYNSLTDGLQNTDVSEGDLSQIGQAGVVFLSIATVGLTGDLTEAQQIYAVLLSLLVWLTSVWYLRNKMAGHKVKLRDALYNAGAPLIPMFLIALVFLVQLIPILLATIGYSAAVSSGLLSGGVEAMLFWAAACLLGLLSLFWATSTIFAMVMVSLPGMYPMKALSNAGDLVLGRRVRILLRWLWMLLVIAVSWAVVMIPFILVELGLKSIWPAFSNVPLIPSLLAILGTLSVVWISCYVYLLYRKVVEGHGK
jgi:hypothetical protein